MSSVPFCVSSRIYSTHYVPENQRRHAVEALRAVFRRQTHIGNRAHDAAIAVNLLPSRSSDENACPVADQTDTVSQFQNSVVVA